MNTFVSLSSPHLGYYFSPNFFSNTGFWVLRKWYKSISLDQIIM